MLAPAITPRLDAAVPQFTVADVVATAEYYRDVVGFAIEGYWASLPVFAIVARDGVQVFFSRANGATPRTARTDGAYDAYIRLAGVDAFADELRRQGAHVIDGPVTRVYGRRELVVRDLNGVVLALGEWVGEPGDG